MNVKQLISPTEAVEMISYTDLGDIYAAKDIKTAFYEEKSKEIAKAYNDEERLRRKYGKRGAAEYEPPQSAEKSTATVPLIHAMTDYKWQLGCLKDRLEHPEKYEQTEDVRNH